VPTEVEVEESCKRTLDGLIPGRRSVRAASAELPCPAMQSNGQFDARLKQICICILPVACKTSLAVAVRCC
jgi:hypothetical protein